MKPIDELQLLLERKIAVISHEMGFKQHEMTTKDLESDEITSFYADMGKYFTRLDILHEILTDVNAINRTCDVEDCDICPKVMMDIEEAKLHRRKYGPLLDGDNVPVEPEANEESNKDSARMYG